MPPPNNPTQPSPSTGPAGLPVKPVDPVTAQPNPMQSLPVSRLSSPSPLTPGGQPSTPVPGTPSASASSASTVAPTTDFGSGDEGPSLVRRVLGFLFSWILVPAALVFIVHTFVFQAWYVDGQSMEPTFNNGDYLIVSKFDASVKKLFGQASKQSVKRGDVVIFNPPSYPNDIFFIKRAIGLPSERVVIRNGTIRIYNDANPGGLLLDEPYVGGIVLEGDVDVVVPTGQVFVVGDNRHPGASQDSRIIGPIPLERVVGTANLRLLPLSQFGSVNHPNYQAATATPSLTP